MPSKWIGMPSPKSRRFGHGWVSELDRAWQDGTHAVMARKVHTEWGEVDHVCIRNAAETDVPWATKQRIKDELFGTDRVAIEVFPQVSELVDEANMYHLWVLPKGFKVPFSLKEGE